MLEVSYGAGSWPRVQINYMHCGVGVGVSADQ